MATRRREAEPAEGDIHDVAAFLAGHPPFSSLDEQALRQACEGAEIEFFPAGAEILSRAGSAARHLYVVRVGSVGLEDEGEVQEILEEGESFGHPSLLSGSPPALTVRAREDTLCYLLPAPAALSALASPAGLRFVASTLRRRLDWAEERAGGLAGDVGAVRAGALISRPPLFCEPELSVREAAERMGEAMTSSLLVTVGDRYGIVTDADLRSKVVATGASYDTPVSAVMTDPAETVGTDRTALELMIEMLDRGMHHCVVVDSGGRALGVISERELLNLEGQSPLAVRGAVIEAADVDQLAAASAQLAPMAVALLDSSVEPLDVVRVIAANSDAVLRRLLAFAEAELGRPPARWAWIGLGSEARREQTLVTDQDNAIAYDGEAAELDGYFEALAVFVNEGLERCGFVACRANVMARNPDWRRPLDAWLALYRATIKEPTKVPFATMLFDFRQLAGDLDAGGALRAEVEAASGNVGFVRRLARTGSDFKPPTGFLRQFVVDADGAHVGTLDIKKRGVVPIVDLARIVALMARSTAVPTVERLRAADAAGAIDHELGVAMLEAFSIVSKVRLEHQAAQLQQGRTPDNHVDPRQLPPLARHQLKDAFRAVAQTQKVVTSPALAGPIHR